MDKKWCTTAPQALIDLYESRMVRRDQKLLKQLLSDERLAHSWRYLSKLVDSVGADPGRVWLWVWSDIVFAKKKSSEAVLEYRSGTRSNTRIEVDTYEGVAHKVTELADLVQGQGTLDVLIDRLLPQGLRRTLLDQGLNDSPEWPTVSEFLNGFSDYIHAVAAEAGNRGEADRRRSGWIAERVFVFHLGKAFKDRFGQPMCGVIGNIMGAVFPASVVADPEAFVKTALRRGGVRNLTDT